MTSPALSTVGSAQLRDVVAALGAPAWRASQIQKAVWNPGTGGFDDVRQLPAAMRAELSACLVFSTVSVAAETESDAGMTVKLLCRLPDGETVEAVAMESPATETSRRRATVCVSSQVGCAVGCPFCATGRLGLRRHCTAAEIVDQVRAAAAALARRSLGRVTHVVFMGMGEPLANYEEVVAAVRVLTHDAGISARRITVSTSGVVPGIDRLSGEGLPVTLAISLHATTDELRTRLVPINRAYPLGRLIPAAREYATATGRRITLEWCLIGGVNDTLDEARGLRSLADDLRAHVNVIPMNRIEGSPWGPPPAAATRRFLGALRGAAMTVRDTRGAPAQAACGQLRAALEPRRAMGPDGRLRPPSPPTAKRRPPRADR